MYSHHYPYEILHKIVPSNHNTLASSITSCSKRECARCREVHQLQRQNCVDVETSLSEHSHAQKQENARKNVETFESSSAGRLKLLVARRLELVVAATAMMDQLQASKVRFLFSVHTSKMILLFCTLSLRGQTSWHQEGSKRLLSPQKMQSGVAAL